MKRSTGLNRSDWSRRVERATLESRNHLADDAAKVYGKLAFAEKMGLAVEIAETRAAELCLAYENVVMVAAGYKLRRNGQGKSRALKTPCVTFVVRRKWPGAAPRGGADQVLPQHLLAYATIEGQRRLCAVPTDVVPETNYFQAKPQSPAGLAIVVAEGVGSGTTTCAIAATASGQTRIFALSCQHVFSPVRHVGLPAPTPGSPVLLREGEVPFARTTKWGGQMRSDGAFSFDAQFAAFEDREVLRRALAGLRLSSSHPYVLNPTDFLQRAEREQFGILVPDRTALTARYFGHLPNVQGIPYEFENGDQVVRCVVNQRLVILFRIVDGSTTKGGDSGCPIVARAADGDHTLVGMHIAGRLDPKTGYPLSYAIPAWLLFDPSQYSSLPSKTLLAPALQ